MLQYMYGSTMPESQSVIVAVEHYIMLMGCRCRIEVGLMRYPYIKKQQIQLMFTQYIYTILSYFLLTPLLFVKSACLNVNRCLKIILQEVYKQSFNKSMLQLHSGVGIANGGVMQSLSPATLDQEPLNLFLLPPLVDQGNKLALS